MAFKGECRLHPFVVQNSFLSRGVKFEHPCLSNPIFTVVSKFTNMAEKKECSTFSTAIYEFTAMLLFPLR